jgi:hypothetical protein
MEHAMLPPVRAALSSNTDFQSLAPAAAARVSLAATTTIAAADSDRAGPISSGRMDALSLSAQLKLAQSFSIFAETIGKVLNLPRGENEALVDYATRLSEAVKALNPAERMVIERLLNQIVKGVTLRLLAEILNDPAGPDAARLAAYIETASASERDLAAKAVVSSYRQNGSAEQTASGGVPRPPAASGATSASPTPTPAGAPAAAPTQAGTAVAASAAPSQTSPTTGAAQPVQAESEQQLAPVRTNDQKVQSAKADAVPAGQEDVAERPAQTAAQAATTAKDAAATRLQFVQMTAGQAGGAEATANAAPASGMAAAAEDGETAPARGVRGEVSADAPRGDETRAKGPRLPGAVMHAASAADGRAGLSNARLMLAELSAWMAGVLLATEPPDAAAAKPSTPAPAPAPSGADMPQNEIFAQEEAAKQAAASAARSANGADTPETARPAEKLPSEDLPGSSSDSAEPLDRQMAALASGWAQTTREGVPWPYVAYPPAEQEPEREERKARAIDEIGDDEDGAPTQDHGFHQEQQDDENEAEEEAKDGAEDVRRDEDEGRPNDLYWRMAGWS